MDPVDGIRSEEPERLHESLVEVQVRKLLKDELSRYMNGCIYFRAFNECDKTQDVACVPEQIQTDNHVRITCGPSNAFDQGS